jgi:hypothetical protein
MSRGTRRALTGLVGAAVLAGVALGTWRAVRAARPAGAADVAIATGAEVTRGGRVVARVRQVVRTRGRGRLPLYLAPAVGPTIDSVRLGVLVPWRRAPTAADVPPEIALVPRDSVPGLAAVARLVVTPGEPGVLVLARPGPR